jgi:hypothetical protein
MHTCVGLLLIINRILFGTLQQERETIVEREKIMEEMERDQESAKTRLEERKVETRQIVEAEIRR